VGFLTITRIPAKSNSPSVNVQHGGLLSVGNFDGRVARMTGVGSTFPAGKGSAQTCQNYSGGSPGWDNQLAPFELPNHAR
jgi:hypothetical protein